MAKAICRSCKILLIATLTLPLSSWAGGLWLTEFGAPAMGRASAGAEAGVDDASTSLYNPASMTRLTGSQFMVTGGIVWSEVEFDADRTSLLSGTDDGGDAGGPAPSASAFFVRPLNDRWWFGTNFYGLTGSALDYKDSWVGRFQATDVDLVFLGLQPTVSYQINDQLSVGASVLIGYTELELTLAVPNATTPLTGPAGRAVLDGDDFEFGWGLGLMWTVSPDTRVGLQFQSKLEPSYSGDVKLQPADLVVGVDADLPLAAFANLGLSHQFNPRWTGYLSVGWQDWDNLDNLLISGEGEGVVVPRDWDDTYRGAAGVKYELNDRWALQGGVAYDTNPADKELRTADLPIDRQVRLAFGVTHTRPSGSEVGAHLVYADYGSAKIDAQFFAGEYDKNRILFLSVSYNWGLN